MPTEFEAVRRKLQQQKQELMARAAKVHADITRSSGPLDKDFAEQVVQMENDAVLAGIGEATAAELAQINRALAQLDAGQLRHLQPLRPADRRAPPAGAAVFRPLHHLRRSRGLTAPSGMPAYKVPLREYRYVLHEVLGAEAHYRALGRDDVNAELIEGVLEGAARFAEDVVAPTNEAGDRVGVRRTTTAASSRRPASSKPTGSTSTTAGQRSCGPVEAGGQGLPESLGGVVGEMLGLRQHVLEALQRPDRQRGAVASTATAPRKCGAFTCRSW